MYGNAVMSRKKSNPGGLIFFPRGRALPGYAPNGVVPYKRISVQISCALYDDRLKHTIDTEKLGP